MFKLDPKRRPTVSEDQPCDARRQIDGRLDKLRTAISRRDQQNMAHGHFITVFLEGCHQCAAFQMKVATIDADGVGKGRTMIPEQAQRTICAHVAPLGKGDPQIGPFRENRADLQDIDDRMGGHPFLLLGAGDDLAEFDIEDGVDVYPADAGEPVELPKGSGVGFFHWSLHGAIWHYRGVMCQDKIRLHRHPLVKIPKKGEEQAVSMLWTAAEIENGDTVSFIKGETVSPLLDVGIGEALAAAAERWPDTEALVSCFEHVRMTYRELDAKVSSLAAGLLATGLEPGDRVAIWAPNCTAWTLLQFATARAGLIFVTFNTAYRRQELAHVLALSGARAIVSVKGFKDIDYAEELESVTAPDLKWRFMLGAEPPEGWQSFEALFACNITRLETVRPDARDPVNIQFTSGTTGRPKGVTLSHYNILNNGAAVGERAGLRPGDRLCIPVPLYHCFGMVMGNLACVSHGVTMVYPAPGFDAEASLRAIDAEGCTHCYGVPTMFIAMLSSPLFENFDYASLRGGIMAGANCPVEVMRKVIDRMNMPEVTIAYGMTETSPVSTQTMPNDPLAARIETVGRVLPHLEIKIVDEDGHIVPRGTEGELCTRGYSVMSGYWGDAAATEAAIDADGYMHSGDLATIDADGFVRITGRAKDMVIRGGENISPREIEEYLYTHDEISDVAVIGVADERFGEAVCAWIVRTPTSSLNEEAIQAFCKGQLAHFKTPTIVRFVSALPMTASGKVQKYLMRAAEAEQLEGVTR